MPLPKGLAKVDKRLILTSVGILLAAFGVAVGLYTLLHEAEASISVISVNETNVLDIHKPLEELTISFQGEDIEKENLNLRIFTIKVENDGEVDILQNYYDQDDIWGLQIQNGEIIEARLVDSNSDYVRSALCPGVIGEENIIEFKKIIFEAEKFFTLEILVLHEKDVMPEIMPIGKIAGIDEIQVVKYQAGEDEGNFFTQLIHGNALVHIVRFFSYLVAFLITAFIVAIFAALIIGLRDNRREAQRKKKVERYWGAVALKEGSKESILSDVYGDHGVEGLRTVKALLEDKDEIRKQVREHEALMKRTKEVAAEEVAGRVYVRDVQMGRLLQLEFWPIDDLLKKGIVTVGKGGRILIDKEFKQLLDALLEYLESHGKR